MTGDPAIGDDERRPRGGRGPFARATIALASFGIVGAWIVLALGQFDVGQATALAAPLTTPLLWPLAPAIVLLLALRRRVMAAVGALAFVGVLGVHAVTPRAPAFDPTVEAAALELRVAVANVLGRTREHARFLAWVETVDPDLVVVIECPIGLADELERRFEHAFARPSDDIDGVAVFSRHPLDERDARALVPGGFPSLAMRVAPLDAPAFDLEAVHPWPPIGAERTARRDEEFAAIATRLADRPASARPLVVAGDFNAPTIDPRLRDLLARARLRVARPYLASVAGTGGTWPSTIPFTRIATPSILRTAIDHCLVDPAWRLVAIETGPEIGSDHRPLVVDLVLPASPPG